MVLLYVSSSFAALNAVRWRNRVSQGGGGTGDWNQPLDWSEGRVPGISDYATSGYLVDPGAGPIVSSPSPVVGRLLWARGTGKPSYPVTIEAGGSVTVEQDAIFGNNIGTVGELIMNGGTLTTGTDLQLCNYAQGHGRLFMNSGVVNVGADLIIGGAVDANGIIIMQGGVINVSNSLLVGTVSGSMARVHINGGAINCAGFGIGLQGGIHIGGGKIICSGDHEAIINSAIDDGRIARAEGADPNLVPVVYYDPVSGMTTLEIDFFDPDIAASPKPANMEPEVDKETGLSWVTAANGADSHNVYFGQSYYEVLNASDPYTLPGRGNQAGNTYDPGLLEQNTVYYWRIDEVRGGEVSKGKVWQFTSKRDFKMFPRGCELAPVIDTVTLSSSDIDEKLAVITLQGQINSAGTSRLFVKRYDTGDDPFWLDWLVTSGQVLGANQLTVDELFSKYANEYSRVVVYDPALPSTINIATMIASVNDGIVVHPDDITTYGNGKIVEDLRGLWTSNVSAYQWAYDNLWDQMNHDVLGFYHPTANYHALRDYFVANKIFHIFVTGQSVENPPASSYDDEYAFLEQLFADTRPNIPVMGWWAGGTIDPSIGEVGGTKLASYYGKFMVGSNFGANFSIYSGTKVSIPNMVKDYKKRQAPYAPQLDPDKVYVAFTVVDSGSGPSYWQYRQYEVWQDGQRGSVAINWSLGPAITELMPGVINWYYQNASPNDSFYMGMSGPGYCYPYVDFMSRVDYPNTSWNVYLNLMQHYIDLLKFNQVHLYGEISWSSCFERTQNDPITMKFVNGLRGIDTIMIDMARDDCIEPDFNYRLGDKLISHITTRWTNDPGENPVTFLVNDIQNHTPAGRPAFMQIQCNSWDYFPSDIEQVYSLLPSDYVAVSPGNLRVLYEQAVEAVSPNPADINKDWSVDIADFAYIAEQWTTSGSDPSADIFPFTGDGIVESDDMLMLLENWLWMD